VRAAAARRKHCQRQLTRTCQLVGQRLRRLWLISCMSWENLSTATFDPRADNVMNYRPHCVAAHQLHEVFAAARLIP
jgi:hypothetical protein